MNKVKFIDETAKLADEFAILFDQFLRDRPQYFGSTDDNSPIAIGDISVSIQNGQLTTVSFSVGSADSKHKLTVRRYPNTDNEWRIEDK